MDTLGQIVPRSQTDMEQIEWPRMESDESSFTNFSMFHSLEGYIFVGCEPALSGTKVYLID